MIRIRVDDFPQTKAEPQHTLSAFREFHRELTALTGKRYLLGVIPKRCSVDDVLFLRNETDCVIGMHGLAHDEHQLDIHQNEFPPWIPQSQVCKLLSEARSALESAVNRPVRAYMPPRNLIDWRTMGALHESSFDWWTSGPETGRELRDFFGNTCVHSQPPYEYGRTDELLQSEAHLRLMEKVDHGHGVVLTLHWTWETNIGLHNMRNFLSQIPRKYFEDFDV